MLTVRAPQSKPPSTALSMRSASISAMVSLAVDLLRDFPIAHGALAQLIGQRGCVGQALVQRFWYGWKMWSFVFTATWQACPQSGGLASAVKVSDAAS